MISKLKIKNFKSYVNSEIELNRLTILSGLNNSGKSSIIQAIRMVYRSSLGKSPYLNDYGAYEELWCKYSPKGNSIVLEFEGIEDAKLEISPSKHISAKNAPLISYIGANRLGPQKTLPIQYQPTMYNYLGENSEYVLDIIKALEFSKIPESLHHSNSAATSLIYEIQGWLSEISPGVNFTFEIDNKSDLGKSEFDSYRPNNVGFGLSYALPIIVAGLALASEPAQGNENEEEKIANWYQQKAQRGALLIVENPEAHLHPRGQTKLGIFLSKVASCGVQVIVETHSDHLVDGVRIAVKDQLIDHENTSFYYLDKKDNLSHLTKINIDRNGRMSEWPNGFFDEALKNRSYLIRN